jgi:hypothetical protein
VSECFRVAFRQGRFACSGRDGCVSVSSCSTAEGRGGCVSGEVFKRFQAGVVGGRIRVFCACFY